MSRLHFLTAGESHGPCLTAIVEGLPAGLPMEVEVIDYDLARRQGGYGRGGRMKIEQDTAHILSGVIDGKTTGSPLTLRIDNRDWANWEARWAAGTGSAELPKLTIPRPGHADYAGMVKYGIDDARPILERASARETAARVAVGAVAKLLLAQFGVSIYSYVSEIGGVVAQVPDLPSTNLHDLAEASDVRCPNPTAAEAMRAAIRHAKEDGDSLGGVIVVTAEGVPVGLGSHVQWDRRLDARLGAAIMSIPAIKGIEIGPAFENARLPGTQVHDEFEQMANRKSQIANHPTTQPPIRRTSNRAGGIEGGISNGMSIVIRAAMKPIPTTITPLRSVDLATGEPAATQYQRSDVCAVPAASIVGEAMMAWVLAEALLEKLGGDSLREMRTRMDRHR
ncbi:MAG: chorismate synthase [Anaerolineae bacterium]|nr:chorismate synthase [Anaerolineae bacterium]